jgi:hypothetical protein
MNGTFILKQNGKIAGQLSGQMKVTISRVPNGHSTWRLFLVCDNLSLATGDSEFEVVAPNGITCKCIRSQLHNGTLILNGTGSAPE